MEDPPYLRRTARAGLGVDYIGISLLVLGVGALQVVLDKGQEDDWFGSHFITNLIVVSAISLVALVIWEWRHKTPVIELRLFKNFNFATANVMMFIFGVLLFSSLVMMPQFLQTVLGYTAENAGLFCRAADWSYCWKCLSWEDSPESTQPNSSARQAGWRWRSGCMSRQSGSTL